jgi:hypothetical protein
MDDRVWTRSGPQKWEYKFVYLKSLIWEEMNGEGAMDIPIAKAMELYSQKLNELGQEHWELVSTGQEYFDRKYEPTILIFKRPYLVGESP